MCRGKLGTLRAFKRFVRKPQTGAVSDRRGCKPIGCKKQCWLAWGQCFLQVSLALLPCAAWAVLNLLYVRSSECSTYCSCCLCGCGTLDAHQRGVTVEREGSCCLPAGPHPLLPTLRCAMLEHWSRAACWAPVPGQIRVLVCRVDGGGCANCNRTEGWSLSPVGADVMGCVCSGQVRAWGSASPAATALSHRGTRPSPPSTRLRWHGVFLESNS